MGPPLSRAKSYLFVKLRSVNSTARSRGRSGEPRSFGRGDFDGANATDTANRTFHAPVPVGTTKDWQID